MNPMAETRDPSSYTDFDELMERLTAIVGSVKAKDVGIEESLDLLEEGIALGLHATDIVEAPEFTTKEQAELAESSLSSTEDAATSPDPELAEAPDSVEAAD